MLLIFSHPLRTRVWRPSGRIPSAVAVGQIEAEPRGTTPGRKTGRSPWRTAGQCRGLHCNDLCIGLAAVAKALQLFED